MLTGDGAPPLGNVPEHPHEGRSSVGSAAAIEPGPQSGRQPSSSHEAAGSEAGSDVRAATAQETGDGKSSAAAQQSADRPNATRFEGAGGDSSSPSNQVSSSFSSPFGTAASRPFAADVGASPGEQLHECPSFLLAVYLSGRLCMVGASGHADYICPGDTLPVATHESFAYTVSGLGASRARNAGRPHAFHSL